MKEFSHPGGTAKTLANLNNGIAATVTISRNAWKYVADIEADLDPALPMVLCNLDEINQVVLNMIVNAADAIRDSQKSAGGSKGRIMVRSREIDGNAQILISDNGCGIEPENLRRVFDPFFTTMESTGRLPKGA